MPDDLINSSLQTPSSSDPDALVDLYSGELSKILDKHAPITTKNHRCSTASCLVH